MVFEEERILEELKRSGRTPISKLTKRLNIAYYKLKFEHIPNLEKQGLITRIKKDSYVYIELTERGLNNE